MLNEVVVCPVCGCEVAESAENWDNLTCTNCDTDFMVRVVKSDNEDDEFTKNLYKTSVLE